MTPITCHHEFLESWTLLQRGRPDAAWEIARRDRHVPERDAGPFAQALASLLRTYIKLATSDRVAAAGFCAQAVAMAESIDSDLIRHGAMFAQAACAFAVHDRDGVEAALKEAFAIGRRRGLWGCPGWDARAVAMLLSEALRAGIDTDYVRELLRRRWLPRPPDARMPEAWVWAVEICAFGGFHIRVGGQALHKSRKSPHRLLVLLRALVAAGGVEVPVNWLCDRLWPDADGDTAPREPGQVVATTAETARAPGCAAGT